MYLILTTTISTITGKRHIILPQVKGDFSVIDWEEYFDSCDEDEIIPLITLTAAEQELTKKPLISLSSIEIEEERVPTFKELMEGLI